MVNVMHIIEYKPESSAPQNKREFSTLRELLAMPWVQTFRRARAFREYKIVTSSENKAFLYAEHYAGARHMIGEITPFEDAIKLELKNKHSLTER